ncbi:TPA: hypothetical protein ACPE3U_004132 [Citrobacter freundii]
MKQFDGLQSLQQPLSGLPQWVSERILQQINQLTNYERRCCSNQGTIPQFGDLIS